MPAPARWPRLKALTFLPWPGVPVRALLNVVYLARDMVPLGGDFMVVDAAFQTAFVLRLSFPLRTAIGCLC